jgi:PAS domain S-box-containing protein
MDQTTELLSAWIESARDYAILLVDGDGLVSSWNVGAERILGYSEAEALGQSIGIFFTPEDREKGVPERELGRALANGRASDDRWHIRKDGSRFWCSGVLMRVGDDPQAPRGFVKVMRDLTERKLMEERLRARTEELMASDRRRNEFLAMLSHELRNPLAPIMTAVYLLRDRLPATDGVVLEAREMIERQTIRLKRLVDGLLDVSRMALNRIHLDKVKVDVAEVATRAVDSVRAMVLERGHTLLVSAEAEAIVVSADPLRLEQVIAALVSNAARFTGPGGQIDLTIGREADQAVVRVRDTGIGMEPELLERAFDLFFQADQGLARTAGGLGIGLTLARSLVQMHGGSIEVASDGPGTGSEFTVRLPLSGGEDPGARDEKPENGRHASSPLPPGTKILRRILLVDDNRDAARSTELVLREAGHDVIVAHDGPAAIALALHHRPDLAILDVGLPQLDGYGVARELRRLTSIPLVAVTGYAPEDTSSLLFDAHLLKPVQPEELVQVLSAVMAR